jgi:hypothetical protein
MDAARAMWPLERDSWTGRRLPCLHSGFTHCFMVRCSLPATDGWYGSSWLGPRGSNPNPRCCMLRHRERATSLLALLLGCSFSGSSEQGRAGRGKAARDVAGWRWRGIGDCRRLPGTGHDAGSGSRAEWSAAAQVPCARAVRSTGPQRRMWEEIWAGSCGVGSSRGDSYRRSFTMGSEWVRFALFRSCAGFPMALSSHMIEAIWILHFLFPLE